MGWAGAHVQVWAVSSISKKNEAVEAEAIAACTSSCCCQLNC
mgnify:CR=1 FL=1